MKLPNFQFEILWKTLFSEQTKSDFNKSYPLLPANYLSVFTASTTYSFKLFIENNFRNSFAKVS